MTLGHNFSEFEILCISETHSNYNDGHILCVYEEQLLSHEKKSALCSLLSDEMRFHLVGMQTPYVFRDSSTF